MNQVIGNQRGILAMLIAMALFTTNDTLVKLATASYPAGQIMLLRGIFATLTIVAIAAWQGRLRVLADIFHAGLIQRGALETFSTACFITALTTLALPNVTAITQATPLVVTLLCLVFRLEQVGWRRLLAVIMGFCGVLVILRPSADGISWASMLALACAVAAAGRDLVTRRLAQHITSTAATFASTLFVAVFGLVLGLFETWQPLAWRETAYLAVAGAFLACGNLAMVIACRGVDLSVVIPFRYSVILWSILAGYLVWGQLPDAIALAGIALIIGSGLYTLHRERMRGQEPLQPKEALQPSPGRQALPQEAEPGRQAPLV